MRIAGAQIHNVVGDLEGNTQQIAEAMAWAEQQEADVLVFPELALTGYPLDDLVLNAEFVDDAAAAMRHLARQAGATTSVISTIERVPPQRSWDTRERRIGIMAKIVCHGEVRGTYRKVLLPTYGIYDEGRNIAPGNQGNALWRIGDAVVGISICEDIWSADGPPEAQGAGGARALLVPNASPYHRGKAANRLRFVRRIAQRTGLPLVYINFYGGQDDLVFDGGSLVVDGEGQLLHRSVEFDADRFCVDVELAPPRPLTGPVTNVHARPLAKRAATPACNGVAEAADELTGVWNALVTATRDFVQKNGYESVVLGLSGGIDSAVTAAVAADALGGDRVLALAMPAQHSPEYELNDARDLAHNRTIVFEVVPLERVESTLVDALRAGLGHRAGLDTARDLEAWARATVLSGYAAEQGRLILATANKSELSIGAVARGDLIGEFAPLRDCPKTLLYKLARHCNREQVTVPRSVLDRPTSAQAFENGELPAYDVLDPIVEQYLEHDADLEDLVSQGFDPEVVLWVLRRIGDSELLRRQAPIGVKITATAFNQDRRMPLSNAYRPHRRR